MTRPGPPAGETSLSAAGEGPVPSPAAPPMSALQVEVGLNAAIVAVADAAPLALVVPAAEPDEPDGLPFGPFDPLRHRTFETGLRTFVGEQAGLSLGYVEQLYTFGDRGRHRAAADAAPHVVSVGYLALARIEASADPAPTQPRAAWRSFYRYLPWEDWRGGRPPIIDAVILPGLARWTETGPRCEERRRRMRLAFGGSDATSFDEERVLDRYELLYEAGLVEEAVRDGRFPAVAATAELGAPMRFDHRRILATAIARLRAKLKYRPVIFELLSPTFTLTELQNVAEAIAGRHIHKQNFRRFVETTQLVDPTGQYSSATGGRPAALFRFRQEVLNERPSPGIRFGRT